MLAGAVMHAPAALPHWVDELPRDRPIAVYCICGFQVSGTAVKELRQRGYNARALVGGITAWHAIGGETVPMDMSTYEGASQTSASAVCEALELASPIQVGVSHASVKTRPVNSDRA
jgi:hypothetical protein